MWKGWDQKSRQNAGSLCVPRDQSTGKCGPWKEEQTPESHSSIDQVHREVRTAPNVANAPSLSKQLETGRLPQMLAGYFSTSMSLYLAVQGWWHLHEAFFPLLFPIERTCFTWHLSMYLSSMAMYGHVTQQDNGEEVHIRENAACIFLSGPILWSLCSGDWGRHEKGKLLSPSFSRGSPVQTFAESLDPPCLLPGLSHGNSCVRPLRIKGLISCCRNHPNNSITSIAEK